MDKTDISDKVEYVIAAISEFGKRHGLSHVEAYRYPKRFQGMDMLDKFYDVMHTLSFKDVTDDLTGFCHRHDGALVSPQIFEYYFPIKRYQSNIFY